MPSLPREFVPGIQILAKLTNDQYTAIMAALREAKPRLRPEELASQITSNLQDIVESKEVRRLIRSVLLMYSVSVNLGDSASKFTERILSDLKEPQEIKLDETEMKNVADRLPEVLALDNPFRATSKAVQVLTAHEHPFSQATIITDIRPVFQDDPHTMPTEAVIIHNLKITYHTPIGDSEFFVALDTLDLRSLKAVIERAEVKEQTARAVIEKADANCLDLDERWQKT